MSKKMCKKNGLVLVLAALLIFTGVNLLPITGRAAASKPGKVKITETVGCLSEDDGSTGVKVRWNKVSGADGYQFRYCLFWDGAAAKPKHFSVKKTGKTYAEIFFQNHTNIYFQVRAYKNQEKNGKSTKLYGSWATGKLMADAVDTLVSGVLPEKAKDIQYVMYLGTNDKDTNEPVFTPEEAKGKAIEVLLKRFGGYTIQEANGGWVDGDKVYKEYTLVIYLSDTTEDDVHEAAKELIDVFHQSSVMIQANQTTTEFYYGGN